MGRETTQRSKKSTSDRKKPHEEFAEQIMVMIGQGLAPWQKAWKAGEYYAPFNPVSGTVYRGVNRLLLTRPDMGDPRWMTFKHAQKAHYRVKAGSKSTPVEFWQWTAEIDRRDDNGKIIYGPDGKPEKEIVKLDRPRIFISNVFHAAQIETEDREPIPAYSPPPLEWNPHEKAEAILQNSGAAIHHDQRDRAYYSPGRDEIHLPYRENFSAAGDYYCTALHELGHWACSKRRLDMEGGVFGSESYAQEELRVEIASWMICQDLGLDFQPESSAAYVRHWMQSIKEDPYEIVRACRDAEKIKGYVLSLERGLDKDDPFVFVGLDSTPAPTVAEMPVFRMMENREPASPDKWFFGLERPAGYETSLEYAGLSADSSREMKDQLAETYEFYVQEVFRAAADVWPEYLPLEMRRRVLSERLLETLALHGKMIEVGALPPESRFRHQEMAEAMISYEVDDRDSDLWRRNLENPGDFQFQYPQFASIPDEAGTDDKDRLVSAYRTALNQVAKCLDDKVSGQVDINARRLVLASALMDLDALHHQMIRFDLIPSKKRTPYLERMNLLAGDSPAVNPQEAGLPEPGLILENQVSPASFQFQYPIYASVHKGSSREDKILLVRAYSTAMEQVSLCADEHRVGDLDIQTRRNVMAAALLDLNILHNQVNRLELDADRAPLNYHTLADVLPESGPELPHSPAERLNRVIERSAANCAVASDFDAMKLALLTTAHVTRKAMESPDFEAPGAEAESILLSLINFETERLDTERDTVAIVETFLHNVVTFANIQGNRVGSDNLGLYRQALQTYVDGYQLGQSEMELLIGESVSFKHDFDDGLKDWRLDAITYDMLCREGPDHPWREPTEEEFAMLTKAGELKLTPTIPLGGDRFLTYDGREHGRISELETAPEDGLSDPAARLSKIIAHIVNINAGAETEGAVRLTLAETDRLAKEAMDTPDFKAPGTDLESAILRGINYRCSLHNIAADPPWLLNSLNYFVLAYGSITADQRDQESRARVESKLASFYHDLGLREMEMATGQLTDFRYEINGLLPMHWCASRETGEILCRENAELPWRFPDSREKRHFRDARVKSADLIPVLKLDDGRIFTCDGRENGAVQTPKMELQRLIRDFAITAAAPDQPSDVYRRLFSRVVVEGREVMARSGFGAPENAPEAAMIKYMVDSLAPTVGASDELTPVADELIPLLRNDVLMMGRFNALCCHDSDGLKLFTDAITANLRKRFADEPEKADQLVAMVTKRFPQFGHDLPSGREWCRRLNDGALLFRNEGRYGWHEDEAGLFDQDFPERRFRPIAPVLDIGSGLLMTMDGTQWKPDLTASLDRGLDERAAGAGPEPSAGLKKPGFVRVYEEKNPDSPDEPSRYLMYAFDRSGKPYHAVMINHDLPPNAVRQIFVSMKLYADAAAKGRETAVLDEIMDQRAFRTWYDGEAAEILDITERDTINSFLSLDENGLKAENMTSMGRNWFISYGLDQEPDKYGPLECRKMAVFEELKRLSSWIQSKDRPGDAKDQLHFTALDSREIDLKDKPYTEMIEKVIEAMWDEKVSEYARRVKAALSSYEAGLDAEKVRSGKSPSKIARAGRQTGEQAYRLPPEEEMMKVALEAGLRPGGSLILDGKIHRVPVEGGRPGNKDGAYCGYLDGVPNGWAMNHKTGDMLKWVANGHTLTDEGKAVLRADVEARKRQVEAEREKGYAEAAGRAFDKLFAPGVAAAPQDHPYLQAKGVFSYGLHQDAAGNLLIEGLDISRYHCVGRGPEPPKGPDDLTPHRHVQTLQTITPGGRKTYEPGTKKTGAAFLIGEQYLKKIVFDQWAAGKNPEPLLAGLDLEPRREILLAEGYATGATLFKATGLPVAVAFDAGNLKPVAEALKKQFPSADIVVCADNDHVNKVNVGLEKAQAAAQAVGGRVVFPEFTDEEKALGLTDFNDLAQARGTFAVTKMVSSKYRERLKPESPDLTVSNGPSR